MKKDKIGFKDKIAFTLFLSLIVVRRGLTEKHAKTM